MKKSALILLFLSILFSSCSKEETTQKAITNNDLLGTWKVTNVVSEKGKISGNISGINLSADFSATGKDYSMNITFSDNPKKIVSTGSFTLVSQFSLATQSKSFEQKISNIPATNGIWNIENNVLTTTENGQTASIDIVSYNNSEIVFKYSINRNTNIIPNFDIKNGKIQADILVKATKQ